MVETQRLSPEELADLTDTDVETVVTMVEAKLLVPDPDGRHDPGDVHRLRLIDAFLEAGIPLAALVGASESGTISFAYYDRLHPRPGPVADRTYGELKASLGERGAVLVRLFAAFGLAEPEPHLRLARADEELIVELLEIAAATGEPELALRVVRLIGDATRRATEAIMTVYDEAVGHVIEPAEGLPSQEVFDRYLLPWTRFAQLAPELGRWLTARHLSNAIDAYSVASTEHYLGLAGYVAPREASPPAVAFVDLSGFTRLAEERGDEPVARMALDFARLAEAHVAPFDGRVVKLLGDGVLLRFADAGAAVGATLELMAALEPAGLPAGHAGIDAGPLIVREGDIFGRTVNLAARIADLADRGEVLATTDVAGALEAGAYAIEARGRVPLQGFAEPIELVRIGPAR